MMKIIYGERRSGKSTILIRLAEQMNAYILVSDHNRACNIRDMANQMGCHILFPITFHEFWRMKNTGYVKNLLIDDGEDLLSHMASLQGWNLQGMTISKNDDTFFEIPSRRKDKNG